MFPSNYAISPEDLDFGKTLADVNRKFDAAKMWHSVNPDDPGIHQLFMEAVSQLETLHKIETRNYTQFLRHVHQKKTDLLELLEADFLSVLSEDFSPAITNCLSVRDLASLMLVSKRSHKIICKGKNARSVLEDARPPLNQCDIHAEGLCFSDMAESSSYSDEPSDPDDSSSQ